MDQNEVDIHSQVAKLEQDNVELEIELANLERVNAEQRSQRESLQAKLKDLTDATEREHLVQAAHHLSTRLRQAIRSIDSEFKPIDEVPKLLLACMPKSGSTWLTSVLQEKLSLSPMRCYLEADRNEQEIDTSVLFQSWGQRVLFVQQHVRHSRILQRICRVFSTKIVVLTRRLDDVVVSLRDHIVRESPEMSMFYAESDGFKRKSASEQCDFIIDHAMPWYFNFYLGWQRAAQEDPAQILLLRYEDMVGDPVAAVERVADFYGMKLQGVALPDVERRDGTRFNQGRVGRGREILSTEQLMRLRKLASYYPECDFESVGL
jgi:LPS sulfotransferase NodH